MNQEQIDYVKTELARGVDPEALRATLRQNGYEEEHVSALMSEAGVGAGAAPATRPDPTTAIPQAPTEPSTQAGTPSMAVPRAPQTATGSEASKKGISTWVYVAGGLGVLIVPVVVVMSVLASLNGARDSGMDASAMQSLANLRSQAEIYSAGNANSYEGLCESTVVATLLQTPVGSAECLDSSERYRASVELNSGEYFCVAGLAAEGAELPATGRFATAPSGFSCE